MTFTITAAGPNPVPVISTTNPFNPSAVGVGHPAFNLIINGTGFIGASQAQINGTNRVTTSISSTKVSVALLAGDIPGSPGNVPVRVINPAPGGGTSAAVNLRVVPKITTVSAASFFSNPSPQTADSVVAGFGLGLATSTAFSATNPLPTNLNGTQIQVTDSAGTTRDAGIFFVTAGQVNYNMPPGMTNGVGTAVVSVNGSIVAAGPTFIDTLSPGMFTFRGDGTGVVAGYVLRAQGANQIIELIYRVDNGQIVPQPINMGPASDAVFLILYGTGMQNNSGPAGVTVDFGNGITKQLGPGEGIFASGLIGVQQINILLPRSLVGRGLVPNLKLTVDGKTTQNNVQIAIQ